MKLIKLKKDNGQLVWVSLSQVVSFQDAGNDLIINCAGNIAYRLNVPGKDIRDMINKNVVLTCDAQVE